MAYADVSWSYKSPLTVQQLNQMVDNSVWTSEHKIFGAAVEVLGTGGSSTCCISPGRINIDNKWLSMAATSHVIMTTTAHWVEEEVSANILTENSATGYYIVAYNDAANTFACKFRATPPVYTDTSSGTSTLSQPQYDKSGSTWYRYLGFVHLGTGAALEKQRQQGIWCMYDNPLIVVTAFVGGWTDKDCSRHMPHMSKLGQFGGYGSNNELYARPNDASSSAFFVESGNVGYNNVIMYTDKDQVIEAKDVGGSSQLFLYGYMLDVGRG